MIRTRSAVLALLLVAASYPALAQPCVAPDAPKIIFTPPGRVGVGQTYAIVWSEPATLDSTGFYTIERASDSSFTSIRDSQQTFSTSASFVAVSEGSYYHRVRAVQGCGTAGAMSAAATVKVSAALPNVVFSVQPAPAIIATGDSAPAQVVKFQVENITKSPINVAVPGTALSGSPQFFTVVDPQGELAASGTITLSPRQPRELEIHFLNVATSAPASYQGFIFMVGQPDPLVVTPYAFVNLKVGATDSVAPRFWVGGMAAEYAFFPGYSTAQPDSARPAIKVQIENPGTTPMDLGAEIGPEVWLVAKSGWNASPIPPKQKIDVELSVDRSRALTGSALPRYTYMTVRSRNGQSSRLLVQDNDQPPQGSGRSTLEATVRSYVVPQVSSVDVSAGRRASRLRLTNVGAAALNAEIFFTPEGVDGFDQVRVPRAVVVVPPNDVVTLTDPLVELFGLSPPLTGQIEVRTASDKIAFLSVAADVQVPAASGGTFTYAVPVSRRGEGARSGAGQTIPGVTAAAGVRATLVLDETSGIDVARGHFTLYDASGKALGTTNFSLQRNSETHFDDVLSLLGAAAGRIDVAVDSGNGTVSASLVLIDTARQSGAVLLAQPVIAVAAPSSFRRATVFASSGTSYLIPGVVNGSPSGVTGVTLVTAVGISAPATAAATITFSFLDSLGFSPPRPTITVPAGNSVQIDNVLESLFGLAQGKNAHGTLIVDSSAPAAVSAHVSSPAGGGTVKSGSLPVIGSASEAITSAVAGMQRPVYADGLEQSTDAGRGSRWDLLLSEISGKAASVTVRLFEAGNRSSPIAEQTYTLTAREQKRLSTVFAAMGLDAPGRRKDRTNVVVVVTPESGEGAIVAVATGTDSRTGSATTLLLSPSGGVPPSGVSRVTPVAPPQLPSRRRAAGH